jgi:adenylosuccinate synthase
METSASFEARSAPSSYPTCQKYLDFLEERTGVEIGFVSTGPERNQTIVRPDSRLEKLVG